MTNMTMTITNGKWADWARRLDWYERIVALLALPVLTAICAFMVNALAWARDREHVDAGQDQDIAVLQKRHERDDQDSAMLRSTLGVMDGRILEILQRMATVEALIRAKDK